MITGREVRQRCEVNRVNVRKNGREWRLTLPEWRGKEIEDGAYYTDDNLDAAITAGAMRRSYDRAQAGLSLAG